MMEFIQRRLLALVVSVAVGAASLPAYAVELSAEDNGVNERPSAAAMVGDALIARPMLLALTVGGTAVYVVTLPFSALGGNAGEAAKLLVVGPAKSTFLRCLGCTEAQDRWKSQSAATADAAVAAEPQAQAQPQQ